MLSWYCVAHAASQMVSRPATPDYPSTRTANSNRRKTLPQQVPERRCTVRVHCALSERVFTVDCLNINSRSMPEFNPRPQYPLQNFMRHPRECICRKIISIRRRVYRPTPGSVLERHVVAYPIFFALFNYPNWGHPQSRYLLCLQIWETNRPVARHVRRRFCSHTASLTLCALEWFPYESCCVRSPPGHASTGTLTCAMSLNLLISVNWCLSPKNACTRSGSI